MALNGAASPTDPSVKVVPPVSSAPTSAAAPKIPVINAAALALMQGSNPSDFKIDKSKLTTDVNDLQDAIVMLSSKCLELTLKNNSLVEAFHDAAETSLAQAYVHNFRGAQGNPTQDDKKSAEEEESNKQKWLFKTCFPPKGSTELPEGIDLFHKLPIVQKTFNEYPLDSLTPEATLAALQEKVNNWTENRTKLEHQVTFARPQCESLRKKFEDRSKRMEKIWSDRAQIPEQIDTVDLPRAQLGILNAKATILAKKVADAAPTATKETVAKLLADAKALKTEFESLQGALDKLKGEKLDGEWKAKRDHTFQLRDRFIAKLHDDIVGQIRIIQSKLLETELAKPVSDATDTMKSKYGSFRADVLTEFSPSLKLRELSEEQAKQFSGRVYRGMGKNYVEFSVNWITPGTQMQELLNKFDKQGEFAAWKAADREYMICTQDTDRAINRKLDGQYAAIHKTLSEKQRALHTQWTTTKTELKHASLDFLKMNINLPEEFQPIELTVMKVDTLNTKAALFIEHLKAKIADKTAPESLNVLVAEAKSIREDYLALQKEVDALDKDKIKVEWKLKYDTAQRLLQEAATKLNEAATLIRSVKKQMVVKEVSEPVSRKIEEMKTAIKAVQDQVDPELKAPLRKTLSEQELIDLIVKLFTGKKLAPESVDFFKTLFTKWSNIKFKEKEDSIANLFTGDAVTASLESQYEQLLTKWWTGGKELDPNESFCKAFDKSADFQKWVSEDKELMIFTDETATDKALLAQYVHFQAALNGVKQDLMKNWRDNYSSLEKLAQDMCQIKYGIDKGGFSSLQSWMPKSATVTSWSGYSTTYLRWLQQGKVDKKAASAAEGPATATV